MVCRSINSICPIHAFLLSRSIQATGGGSCWAVLLSLISKGYKLQYPAQSEQPGPFHPFIRLPQSRSALFRRRFPWRPPSLFHTVPLSISLSVRDGWGCPQTPLDISPYKSVYTVGKQTHMHRLVHAHEVVGRKNWWEWAQGQAEATEGASKI